MSEYGTSEGAGQIRAARALLGGLRRLVLTLRLQPALPAVHRQLLRQLRQHLQQACHDGALRLQLRGELVHVADAVVADASSGNPLAPLAALGIGGVVFGPETDEQALAALAAVLAGESIADAMPEDDLVARLGAANPNGIELLAADLAAVSPPPSRRSCPLLVGLPPPAPIARELRPLVAREATTDLAAQLARWLLADLETEGGDDAPLQRLLRCMLARGERNAAFLLEQVERHPQVTAATLQRLRASAAEHLRGPTLRARLQHATGDELLGPVALALQLGGGFVTELLQAAATAGADVPDWLADLVLPLNGA
ncbi:MAG TPA: hypothetical protein VK348_13975 [Planctomycetota bacterium]|nr:hypothetical protein [Planctomycetota bacterium]